jgi:hypothetical protein
MDMHLALEDDHKLRDVVGGMYRTDTSSMLEELQTEEAYTGTT